MEAISYRQSVFLLSMILPVTGHFLLLPPLFTLSGKDGWIAILYTFPIGLVFVFVLYRLHKLYPDKTIVEMLVKAFGRVLGKLLTIFILAYFMFMLIVTMYALFDFIQVVFLPETPRWALAISFYMVVLYGIYVGIESVARMAEPLFLIIIITGVSIGIAVRGEKNYENLFPILETGFSPVLSGILLTTALFGEFLIMMMLILKKDHPKSKSLLFTNIVLLVLITIMFVATTTSSLAIFGEEQVKIMEHPAQGVVRLVIFPFAERWDIYGIATMVLGCVIRMSTFQYILSVGIQQWLNIQKKWFIHTFIVIAVLSYTLFGIKNHQYFVEILLTKLYPLTAAISVGLPLITWAILEVKNRIYK